MSDEFLEIEDLTIEKVKKAKKVDGKKKGNRVELQLCKYLTDFFKEDFTRSVGSGNRWSQASLSNRAKQVFAGDICVPDKFKWVIECKGGYENSIDLNGVCNPDGLSQIDKFIEQSTHDSKNCGRIPMVCWKRSRKPWLVMMRKEQFELIVGKDEIINISYKGWVISSLDEVLNATNRKFWFEK